MEDKRFEVVSQDGRGFSYLRAILVDKETGVNYLFVQSGYAGGLTPLLDADGKTITEEKEVQIPMFRPVKVFDVSQTDGKPLPEQVKSPIAELTGNVEHYEAFMEALRRVSPVPIEMKPLSNDLDGFFSPSKQSITLREGMSEVQTVCAAVHEIAHSKLHNYAMQPDSQPKDSSTEEIEAESIAYTVCAYFGIETSANSFGYVATWSKDKDLKAFKDSLDTIRKTSSELISGVEQQFKEICKERGISLEPAQPAQKQPEQDTEKLYMVDNEKYIHVQRSDTGIDYTIYDAASAKALDGGVLDDTGQLLSAAALTVCKLHNIGDAAPIRLAPLELLNGLQEANELLLGAGEQITGVEATSTADSLPDLPQLEQGYPMPDTAVGFLEMYQYGYTDGNTMLPLTKERAMELFMQDVPVFLLYGDNTEAMALDAEDISSHTGVFGVEREEWDAVRGVVTLSEQADTEKLFLENPQDAFLIYQIRRGGELDAYRFMNYDYLQSKGVTPERGGYDAIYTGGFMDYGNARANLDMIYQRFNVDHPADFKGHSLSVSDIVALKQNGVVSCHYVDSIGFRELPNFLKPENYLKNAEMAMEDDYGMIDGVINNGPKQTVAELEEQAKSGKPISLMELAQAARREQAQAARQEKKPSVLAKLCPPVNEPKKTARSKRAERELL